MMTNELDVGESGKGAGSCLHTDAYAYAARVSFS